MNMSRARMFTAAIFGVLGLSGFASVAASATTPGWMVNGGPGGDAVVVANQATVDQRTEFSASGITIVCLADTLKMGTPELNGVTSMADAQFLEFSECEVTTGNPPCKIAAFMAETIKTLPVLVDLTLDGALAAKGRILATNVSKILATIAFEGNSECPLAKVVQVVHGAATFLAPTLQDEKAVQRITITNEEPGSLKLSNGNATLTGSYLVHLPNSEPFSFL